jgi:CheY-like chemotaxis protein
LIFSVTRKTEEKLVSPSTITPRNRCASFARAAGAGTILARAGAQGAPRLATALPGRVNTACLSATPSASRAARATKHVLIVEDDDITREMLATILQAEGYMTDSVANGREALAYLSAQAAPDLILLDLLMPVMNGWEFRAAQAADPRLASIPVVVVSATEQAATETEPPLQPTAHLRKPITVEELLDVVGRC